MANYLGSLGIPHPPDNRDTQLREWSSDSTVSSQTEAIAGDVPPPAKAATPLS